MNDKHWQFQPGRNAVAHAAQKQSSKVGAAARADCHQVCIGIHHHTCDDGGHIPGMQAV